MRLVAVAVSGCRPRWLTFAVSKKNSMQQVGTNVGERRLAAQSPPTPNSRSPSGVVCDAALTLAKNRTAPRANHADQSAMLGLRHGQLHLPARMQALWHATKRIRRLAPKKKKQSEEQALITDLQRTDTVNVSSEESEKITHNLGNVEYFELGEVLPHKERGISRSTTRKV